MRRDNVHDGDVDFSETTLRFSDVDLLQLTVSDVLLLVDDASLCTSDGRRWQRGGEDEAGSVRPNHVDEIKRASDVTANSAISLAEST